MPLAGVFDKQYFPRAAQGMAGAFNEATTTPVAASQTIAAGDWVSLSSGAIQQAIALPGSNNTGSLSGGSLALYGVALDSIVTNSSGVDTTSNILPKSSIPVALWDGNLELLLRVWNATAANTPITNFVLGSSYQLGRWRGASSGINWYFISTTTTNGECQYADTYGTLPFLGSISTNSGDQQPTDQYPLMWVRVNESDRQVGG